MGFIYILTSPSGKSYIGQTIRSIEERFGEHLRPDSGCVAIARAIKKHGWDNFVTDYYECPDDELDKHETLMIEVLGTLKPGGYNLTTGGSNGRPSEETRTKMREAQTGELNHFYGKTHTDETKQKLSEASTGKTHTEEAKRKMSEARSGERHNMYGKKHTEEAKRKMSEAHTGKTLTKEHKQKLSDARLGEKNHASRKVYQYDLDGNYMRPFGSVGEAGRSLGIYHTTISACARGERKSAGCFKWSYDFVSTI
jgi:hypothetical protein